MSKLSINIRTLFIIDNRKQYYFVYSCLFVLIALFLLLLFVIFGKVPIWDGDAISQSFPAYVFSREWLEESIENSLRMGDLEAINWLPSIGFGQDIRNVVSLRLNYLSSMLFTRDSMIVYLWLFIFLRMYFIGVTFSEFCFYHHLEKFAVLNGAIAYSFCSYALMFGVRHYYFLDMLLFLPLVLLGIERILRENKGGLLLVSVAITACTSLYFLYIIAVLAVVYFVIRSCTFFSKKDAVTFLKKSTRCLVFAIVGVLLSMVIVYPELLFSSESSRLGESSQTSLLSQLHYHKKYYVDFFANLFTAKDLYLGLVLGLPGLVGVCAFLIFSSRKQYVDLKIAAVLILVCMFVPFASHAMNAFSGNGMRWSFVLPLVSSIAIAVALPQLFQISERCEKGIIILSGLYFAFIVVLSCFGKAVSIEGVFFLVAYLGFFGVINYKRVRFDNQSARIMLALLLVFNIFINAWVLYSPTKNNFFSELHNASSYQEEVFDLSTKYPAIIDESLYRVDELAGSFGESAEHRNYGFRTGSNGVSSYYSMTPGTMKAYYNEMGIQNRLNSFYMLNLAHRTALNTMSSVKYLTSETMNIRQIPFGYELIGSTDELGITENGKTAYIFQNQYFLPYMYLQDRFIDRDEYLSLNPVDKEQAALQGVVLEQYQGDFAQKVRYVSDLNTLLTKAEIAEQINSTSGQTGISIRDNSVVVKKGGARVKLAFDSVGNSEILLVLSGVEFSPKNPNGSSASTSDIISDTSKKLFWNPPSSARIIVNDYDTIYLRNGLAQYYEGPCDAVSGIGYHEDSQHGISLVFSEAGIYSFSDIQIVENSMNDYSAQAKVLQSRGVENITVDGNDVYGSVNADKKGILCINIPYGKGWSAYVDGVEQSILVANTMYMGLEIGEGSHEIKLHYDIRGIKEGLLISLITFVCLLTCMVGRKALSRKKPLGAHGVKQKQ